MTRGTIFKIQRYALHDGPGIRTTVFLKGCPLACPWCHNPEGIAFQPASMGRPDAPGGGADRVGTVLGVDALMAAVEKDQLYYDESGGGVTFSGGEPLAQPAFLAAALAACRRREIHTALDTSGCAPAAVLAGILDQVDLVLFDLKIIDEKRHRAATGRSNRRILKNLGQVAAAGTPLRLRVPLIPGWTDDADNLERIAALAVGLASLQAIDLLPYHRTGAAKYRRLGLADAMAGVALPSERQVAAARQRLAATGITVTLGGSP